MARKTNMPWNTTAKAPTYQGRGTAHIVAAVAITRGRADRTKVVTQLQTHDISSCLQKHKTVNHILEHKQQPKIFAKFIPQTVPNSATCGSSVRTCNKPTFVETPLPSTKRTPCDRAPLPLTEESFPLACVRKKHCGYGNKIKRARLAKADLN